MRIASGPLLAFLLLVPRAGQERAATAAEHDFHRDHVLGTSLDATLVASSREQAEALLNAVVAETERLARILSSYDEQSELARLLASGQSSDASRELREVLEGCAQWQRKSGGAFDVRVGELIATWKAAQNAGVPPEPAVLEGLVARMRESGWKIDSKTGAVELVGRPQLVLNSFAKSYILQRSIEHARRKTPAVSAGLIAIGGDLQSFGVPTHKNAWRIAIADPAHPADNSTPLCALNIKSAGVATSAGYARGFEIAGKHYSHIIDPRSGMPVTSVASATVVAKDAVSAGPLATTLCVLTPEQGLALVAKLAGTECLIVTADGKQHVSAGMPALLASDPAVPVPAAASKGGWKEGAEVQIKFTLPEVKARGYRRPYVAIWIEDQQLKLVRTVVIWGNERRWLNEMSHWIEASGYDGRSAHATTRATRAPGEYTVVWDGLDDAGKAVGTGEYIVCIEIAREHGGHTIARRAIACGGKATKLTIPKNGELVAGEVAFRVQTGAK